MIWEVGVAAAGIGIMLFLMGGGLEKVVTIIVNGKTKVAASKAQEAESNARAEEARLEQMKAKRELDD